MPHSHNKKVNKKFEKRIAAERKRLFYPSNHRRESKIISKPKMTSNVIDSKEFEDEKKLVSKLIESKSDAQPDLKISPDEHKIQDEETVAESPSILKINSEVISDSDQLTYLENSTPVAFSNELIRDFSETYYEFNSIQMNSILIRNFFSNQIILNFGFIQVDISEWFETT